MEGKTGLGDFGKTAVTWTDDEDAAVKKSIKEFGFNLVTSDKVALDRIPADLRDSKCKYVDYPKKLPRVSVIIVFHNEGWSPLLRTVHTVIKQSPPEILGEIVMVDDFSAKAHLKEQLDDHLKQFNGLVKVVRNERREGLIRARSIGAQNAKEEVLVFLDAHCEPEPNWLPPLLAPIARNDRISTVPMIDGIDGNTYKFSSQGKTSYDMYFLRFFNLNLLFQAVVINMVVLLVLGIGVFFGKESNFHMKNGISFHQRYNHSHRQLWLVDCLRSTENISKIFYITILVLKFGAVKILN